MRSIAEFSDKEEEEVSVIYEEEDVDVELVKECDELEKEVERLTK